MKTLQEHYNLIKEGKGHKDVFLKEAKRIYPDLIPNSSNFEHTSRILKDKSIISENIWGVVGSHNQPDWFKIFNENINEAKVVEKETTKEVDEMKTKGFDYTDPKNIDNVYGEEFLRGYYTEMKDPKNSKKTIEELLSTVAKNLAKDRLHYVKDGQFGVKGLGYVTEHPGLGTPKEVKGKYKSSGMEAVKLKESKHGDKADLGIYKSELNMLNKIKPTGEKQLKRKEELEKKIEDLEKKLAENKTNDMIKLINILEGEYYDLPKKSEKKETKKPEKKETKKSPISDKIKEIEQQGSVAALEAKMNALDEEIRMREDKLRMVQENEDLQEFINPTRINEMEKEIKELSKAKEKYDKMYEKMSGGKRKEVIDEKEEVEEGLPKGYWSEKIPGGKMEESYETLTKKIKSQGQSEKAAKSIAGAVASYKAKGGGTGPTAKQK